MAGHQRIFRNLVNRCLHCGSDKHRAFNCPVKKSLMEKNGGKLPPGYKSAFDKSKATQPKPVAQLIEDEEDDETTATAPTPSAFPALPAAPTLMAGARREEATRRETMRLGRNAIFIVVACLR